MDSDVSASGSDAEESKLGRLDHWESVYAVELRNLSEHGDEGEVWCALTSLWRRAARLLGSSPMFKPDSVVCAWFPNSSCNC